MATRASHNKNNSAVKRIMQEARELANDPSTDYTAAPLDDNLFEWHCTMRGPPDTDFEGGLYHFRIILPAEYPFRPPSLVMLTPSGRFETNTKICISFTNYHEDLWQPAWGVRTAIIGLQGFFPLKGQAAMGVGSMEAPTSERRRLAKLSREWVCPQCRVSNCESLPDPAQGDQQSEASVSVAVSMLPPTTVQTHAYAHASDRECASPSPTPSRLVSEANAASNPRVPTEVRAEAGGVSGAASAERDSVQAAKGEVTQRGSWGGSQVITQRTGTEARSVERRRAGSVETVQMVSASAPSPSSPTRPPILLDATISVLLVLVAALLCRKVF